jgi:hypothetical protein
MNPLEIDLNIGRLWRGKGHLGCRWHFSNGLKIWGGYKISPKQNYRVVMTK